MDFLKQNFNENEIIDAIVKLSYDSDNVKTYLGVKYIPVSFLWYFENISERSKIHGVLAQPKVLYEIIKDNMYKICNKINTKLQESCSTYFATISKVKYEHIYQDYYKINGIVLYSGNFYNRELPDYVKSELEQFMNRIKKEMLNENNYFVSLKDICYIATNMDEPFIKEIEIYFPFCNIAVDTRDIESYMNSICTIFKFENHLDNINNELYNYKCHIGLYKIEKTSKQDIYKLVFNAVIYKAVKFY